MHWNCVEENIQMSGHNIRIGLEIRK